MSLPDMACGFTGSFISAAPNHDLPSVAPFFETESRGSVDVKHPGAIDMYFLNLLKPEFSADRDGCVPNDNLRRLMQVH
jgi:hypothetical protein